MMTGPVRSSLRTPVMDRPDDRASANGRFVRPQWHRRLACPHRARFRLLRYATESHAYSRRRAQPVLAGGEGVVNETWVTVVGNVASDVSWRRTPNGGEVANFRLMSTERRYDSESGSWEDGNRVAVRVACWRKLGENVRTCVAKGDPVVVRGKLYVREYEADGVRRSSTEIEARSVGLDLSRVRAKVVPVDGSGPGRAIVDVSGLTVVDGSGGLPGSEEMFVGEAPAEVGVGGRGTEVLRVGDDVGDGQFAGPERETADASALAG